MAQYLVGIVLATAGVFLLQLSSNLQPVAAQSGPDVVEDWRATKVLAVNTASNVGNELHRGKPVFAIGPGEWTVNYQVDGQAVYRETWSLPVLPDCYRTPASCSPGGVNAGKFLWALVCDEAVVVCPASTWRFELRNPDEIALFGGGNGRAYGQGTISGKDNRNIHNITLLGAYGWAHGRFVSGGAGGFVWAGLMLPMQWKVAGDIL